MASLSVPKTARADARSVTRANAFAATATGSWTGPPRVASEATSMARALTPARESAASALNRQVRGHHRPDGGLALAQGPGRGYRGRRPRASRSAP